MRGTVKAPLRPFEYMAWAMSVPQGARFDLTRSGMDDTVELPGGDLTVASLTRRDESYAATAAMTEAVAQRYGVDASNVAITIGASQAIMQVLIALVRAGDHVVVERPTYEALHRAPEILGARVSRLERTFEDDWAVMPDRLAQLLTSRTRAVILSNLHNPSGVGIDAAALSAVADLAARVGAKVLIDEVYLDYGFSAQSDAVIQPGCLVARNAISWSSTTKAFGFSALRSGWIVCGDPDAARAIRAAAAYLHVEPPIAGTVLGRRALQEAAALQARAEQKSRAGREVVERWLERESRLEWVPPSFGITAALRLPTWLGDGVFAEHLRERYDTQVVPGTMFEAPGYVRFSYIDDLEEALTNITSTLDDLS
jgi:hypothetical protein